MNASLRAAVIGGGLIGAQLDEPGASAPLTHAGGYRAAGFELVAIADCKESARNQAKRWGCAVCADLDEAMGVGKPDVVSLAVPTSERAALLRQALVYRPRAVVAEKPLASSSAEGETIVRSYREAGVPLVVNYTRRFVPLWQRLRGGEAMSTTIRYAKGLRHNGTHAIDLCRMLFGECTGYKPLAKKYDHWDDDPTVSAFLAFERCPEVFLQALDERCFTQFEVDVISATSRVTVDSDGRRLRPFELRDGVGIPPGKRLVETAQQETGAASAMINLMRHVMDVAGGAEPLCTGEDAVAAQRIAERIAA
jgi:predicted dehydrogenase